MTGRMQTRLDRATFSTSRLLDFCSQKELIAQTGHQPYVWPLVVIKELVDTQDIASKDTSVLLNWLSLWRFDFVASAAKANSLLANCSVRECSCGGGRSGRR